MVHTKPGNQYSCQYFVECFLSSCCFSHHWNRWVSNIRKKEYIQNRWLQKSWRQGEGLTNTITRSTGTYQKKVFQPSCFLSVPWTTNILVKTVFYMQNRRNCRILVNFISDIISIWLHIEMFWAFQHFDVYFRSCVSENNKYNIYKSMW